MSSDPFANAAHDASDGLPQVTVVLVVSDGASWLRQVLATLARQRYPALDLVVVDNATTDGSGDLLARRVPSDRLIRLTRPIGFPRAVAAATQHQAAAAADFFLLCHDDLALHPDALTHLVKAMQSEPSLGVVGPKLREWSEEPLLQQVGMSADPFGRAESELEMGELDQGQHDGQRETLYLSTAGMLVRGEVFRRLGGFDPRFVAFRDDLDLCWRAWLAGYRVETVPAAVGYHVAATSRLTRRIGASDARAMAERHGLAAVLKNYSAARLAWVLPVTLVLAVGKTLGFVATRRFGDALAVVRAYVWNGAHLARTVRRRRAVQSRRVVTDAQLSRLFASGLTRARDYAEAAGGWLTGGSAPVLLDDEEAATELTGGDDSRGAMRFVRAHPTASAGMGLLAVYLVGLLGLLGPGQLVGGQIAPWPESAREFLRAYASHWHGEPVGSGGLPSPIQVVLGLGSLLALGSQWVAQRLLVLGLLPLAWVLAYRAGRLITAHAGPRVLGATLYTLSPAVLVLLAEGRFGVLVLAALLPGLVLLAVRVLDPHSRVAVAWRAAALLALGGAIVVGAAPASAPVIALAYAAALGVAARRRYVAIRMGVAGLGALAILGPWLVGVVRHGLGGLMPAPSPPLWRALTAAPVLPGGASAVDLLAGVVGLAVVAVAVLFGLRTRPRAVSTLSAVVGVAGLAAWGGGQVAVATQLVPSLLVTVALALAGLGVIGARCLGGEVRGYAFGTRQLAAVTAVVVVVVGVLGGAARVATGPWDGLAREPELVPAFVDADRPEVGPYRVLVLAAGDQVSWDLVEAGGPSMLGYGTLPGHDLLDEVSEAVTATVGGTDPRAGATLGVANVRYVVVSDRGVSEDDATELIEALARQPALEPLPSGEGRVFSVRSWLPRAGLLPASAGQALLATGDPGATAAVEHDGLARVRRDVYSGSMTASAVSDGGGLLVVSEESSPRWRANADGRPLERRSAGPVNAFAVPAGAEEVTVAASGGLTHYLLLGLQALLTLAVGSLALRPPVFARRRVERATAHTLPEDLPADEAPATAEGQESVPS